MASDSEFGVFEHVKAQGGLIAESAVGGQQGRVPVALRKQAKYEAVTAEEASARMAARKQGTMDPIENGIGTVGTIDPGKAKRFGYTAKVVNGAVISQEADNPEKLPGEPVYVPVSVPEGSGEPELDPFNLPSPAPKVQEPVTGQVQVRSNTDKYLEQRNRVSFQMEGGTYSVPAVDVVACDTGLIVLLPLDPLGSSFVPGVGTELVVAYDRDRWNCFFPGTAFMLTKAGVQVLVFILKE